MHSDLENKVYNLLKNNTFTQEELYSFSFEDRIAIIGSNLNENEILSAYKTMCEKRNLVFFRDGEIIDFFNKITPETLQDKFAIELAKQIKTEKEAISLLEIIKKKSYNLIGFAKIARVIYKNVQSEKVFLVIYAEFINNILNETKDDIIYALSVLNNDKFIVEFLNRPAFKFNGEETASLIANLKDDDLKEKYLIAVPKRYREIIIVTFKDDEKIIKNLSLINITDGSVISAIKDDALKEKYLRKYWIVLNSETKGKILSTFNDKKYIEKYLPYINTKTKISLDLYQEKEKQIDLINYANHKKIIKHKKEDLNLIYLTKESILFLANNIMSSSKIIEKISESGFLFFTDNETGNYIIDELFKVFNQKNIKKLLLSELPFYYVIKNINNLETKENIIEVVEHGMYQDLIEQDYIYKEEYKNSIEKIANCYNVSSERLIFLCQNLNCGIIKCLRKDNLRCLLKTNEENWNKLKQLFNKELYDLDINNMNDILNSFLQRKFAKTNPETINIFHDILDSIINDPQSILDKINLMNDIIDVDEILSNYGKTKEELIENIKQGNHEAINILHVLTDKYIKKQREKYTQNNLNDELNKITDVTHNINQTINYLFANNSIEDIWNCILSAVEQSKFQYNASISEPMIIIMPEMQKIIDNNILIDLIKAKKTGNFKDIDKNNINIFNRFLRDNANYLSKNLLFNNYYVDAVNEIRKEKNVSNAIDILQELKIEQLTDGILKNDEKFNLFMDYCKKYKLLGWGNIFEDIGVESNLLIGNYELATLITYFDKIYDMVLETKKQTELSKNPNISENDLNKIIKDQITLTSLLDCAYAYCPTFLSYKKLFGLEDYKLILSDPNPYKSHYSCEEKLKKCSQIYKTAYEREKITVKPINKVYNLNNNKMLKVNLGNITNPINLTYGERTGACMRMGGAAGNLFNFAIENENGFHIRITDPNNNEFISRVTGFRNGNTVCLNQMRFPLNNKYTTEDLYELAKLISEDIINETKNDKNPIENVIISPSYAFENYKSLVSVDNVTKGYDDLYTDIIDSAICLATSNNNEGIAPIRLNPEKTTYYDILRDDIKFLDGFNLMQNIEKVEMVNGLLNDVSLEDIYTKEYNNLLFGYVGEDFYIVVDSNLNVISFVVDKRKNNQKTIEEYNICLKYIHERIDEYTKNNNLKTDVSIR